MLHILNTKLDAFNFENVPYAKPYWSETIATEGETTEPTRKGLLILTASEDCIVVAGPTTDLDNDHYWKMMKGTQIMLSVPAGFFVAARATAGVSDLTNFVASPFGAVGKFQVIEEEVSFAAGATQDTTFFIPDRYRLMAVSWRTTETIPGPTSVDIGTAGSPQLITVDAGKYAGQSDTSVNVDMMFYANTHLRITAKGSNFTGGGKMRISAVVMTFTPPGM